MNFCNNCENMLYIKLQSETSDELVNYCRNCGTVQPISTENLCILKTSYKRNEDIYINSINEYTKLDPTLPRINNIKCPNVECISNKDDEKREIIYVRYDDTKIKYVYLCCACDHTWKIDNQGN